MHAESLLDRTLDSLDKNMKFTRQKRKQAPASAPRPKQPVMTYKLHYVDKGLLHLSGEVELGLTRSRTFDCARYAVDATLSDIEFRGTVRVFCDDVDRFVAAGKGLRATLTLEIADFRAEGSGAAAARALRAVLRRLGSVEVEL